jgi:hypothetical protein
MPKSDPFDVYRQHEWFESLAWQHRWIEYMVGWWCGTYGVPKTMIDYGSGDGWWSHSFKQIGSETCFAIELDEIAREHTPPDVYFKQHDLRQPLTDLQGHFDLVMCLEVAEHLPKHEAHNALLATLAKSTASILIFSAAQPGQEGTGHINPQPVGYWIEAIEKWPYVKLSNERTAATRQAFERIVPEGLEFLPRNLLVFARV